MKEIEQTLLDQIKDQVASKYGYKSWEILYGLRESKHAILKLMDEVAELYATAKAKASCEATLKKASENAGLILNRYGLCDNGKIGWNSIQIVSPRNIYIIDDGNDIEIDKSSITDPSNIVIL